MAQDIGKHGKPATPPHEAGNRAPPAPSRLPDERDNPGLDGGGTGGVGSPRPLPGARARDQDVGDRHVGEKNKGHLTTMPDIEE